MVLKRKSIKSAKSKSSSRTASEKPYKLIATAKITYGPYSTKAIAQQVIEKVKAVPRARISSIIKTSRGYSFSVSMLYGLKTVGQKGLAISTIKKHAPTAKISFKKA